PALGWLHRASRVAYSPGHLQRTRGTFMNGADNSNGPNTANTRRRFLVCISTAAGAAVLGMLARSARADDVPHVAADDQNAKALSYTEEASKAGPPHLAGQQCANCTFFSGGSAAYGPCPLFPGKSVNSKGWCTAYAKRS